MSSWKWDLDFKEQRNKSTMSWNTPGKEGLWENKMDNSWPVGRTHNCQALCWALNGHNGMTRVSWLDWNRNPVAWKSVNSTEEKGSKTQCSQSARCGWDQHPLNVSWEKERSAFGLSHTGGASASDTESFALCPHNPLDDRTVHWN